MCQLNRFADGMQTLTQPAIEITILPLQLAMQQPARLSQVSWNVVHGTALAPEWQ